MPSSFSDSRDDHLKRSAAFLREAYNRTNDDLLYRSAIGDAVEAIKHAFQAYLWQRAAEVAADERRQRWQITAADAKMPDLIATVQEAGMTLNRSRGDEVLNLNRKRNRLTHDSPRGGSRISAREALDAVKLAQDVRNAVVVALGGKPDNVFGAATVSSAAAAAARSVPSTAPAAPSLRPADTPPPVAAGAPAAPLPTTPAPVSVPTTSGGADEDDDDTKDSDEGSRPRRRTRTGWLVALAAVLALLVGLSGGVALGYPLGQGHVPSWVPSGLLPAASTPTLAAATATATPATATGPFAIGALLVTPSACGVSPATLTLVGTGSVAVNWSAGSPDSAGAAFALSFGSLARPTISGRLIPGASVTLIISGITPGAGHVVIVADGGALAVPVGAC